MAWSIILEAVLVLLSGIVLIALCAVLNNVIRIHLATEEFKRKSRGLPMLENSSLIFGHIIGLVFKRQLPKFTIELHKHYGKTVGWMYREKRAASTIDLDFIKKLVLDEPDKHLNRIHLDVPLREFDEDCIMLSRDDQWRRIRKAVAPALTKQKFKAPNVVERIENSVNKLIGAIETRLDLANALEGCGKKPVVEMNISDLMHRYTLNLVYSCFYKQYSLIDFNSRKDHHTEMVDSGLAAVYSNPLIRLGVMFPIIKPLLDWLIMNVHPQGKWRSEIMNFIKMQTKQSFEARKQLDRMRKSSRSANEKLDEENFSLADGSKFNRNMMDTITDALYDGKLTNAEYFNTACFLMGAADKTSSDTLSTILYYFSIDEQLQEKTRAAVLAEGVDSTYLSWVVNESLRVCPPASIGCSRVTSTDITLDSGILIPKDTFISTPLYAIHRSKEYWGEDAAEFRPERWANAKSFHPCQFMPFGAGIRSCPGKEFAVFEIKTLLCALLARYKFEGRKMEAKFDSPFLIFLVYDKPTYIKVSRI